VTNGHFHRISTDLVHLLSKVDTASQHLQVSWSLMSLFSTNMAISETNSTYNNLPQTFISTPMYRSGVTAPEIYNNSDVWRICCDITSAGLCLN